MTGHHIARNRERWDATSDEYQRRNAPQLDLPELAWGVWHLLENDLQVLGQVDGLDVLELGCGAAQWSVGLAQVGARPTGIDLSGRQLEHARERVAAHRVRVPLVQGNAEELPFRDASFDVVFADWGAPSFTDPDRTIPEAARVLRPGGLLAFSTASPWWWACYDDPSDRIDTALHKDYFGMRRWEWPDEPVEFNLTYGDWIRLFRASGLLVEDLLELQAPPEYRSTYRREEEHAWSRRWPGEIIWRARRT